MGFIFLFIFVIFKIIHTISYSGLGLNLITTVFITLAVLASNIVFTILLLAIFIPVGIKSIRRAN